MKTPFEKHIEASMRTHEVDVSPNVWAKIKPDTKRTRFIYYSKRISIACLIFLFGSYFGTHINFSNEKESYVFVTEQPIKKILFSETNNEELKLVFAKINIPKIKNKVSSKPTQKTLHQNINNNKKETIVLNIKSYSKKNRLSKSNQNQKTIVDTKSLLAHVEQKIKLKEEKELRTYLADIKKITSKKSINNSLVTVQNWITDQSKKIINHKKTQ